MSIPLSLLLLMVPLQPVPAVSANLVDPITTESEGIIGSCPTQEKREAVIENITASILDFYPEICSNCGSGLWYRVASLNMSDPSQQCPSAWSEYNTEGVRAYGRSGTNVGTCSATLYATNHQYSRVCGRVIGDWKSRCLWENCFTIN